MIQLDRDRPAVRIGVCEGHLGREPLVGVLLDVTSAEAEARAEVDRISRDIRNCMDDIRRDLPAKFAPGKTRLEDYEIYDDRANKGNDSFPPHQQIVVEGIQKVRYELSAFVAEGRGLILYGGWGTGKTRFLSYLAYAASRYGISVRFVEAAQLFAEIAETVSEGGSVRRVISKWRRPQVLVIDDPKRLTESQQRNLFQLVDGRSADDKCTWVSLNVTNEREAVALLGGDTWSRLHDGAVTLCCSWGDYRRRSNE
jgi:DNA replication protein DnaC